MLQISEVFKGHEFVIWFWRPSIDLNRVLQGYNKELDPFVLDNTEVNCTLQFTNINPSISSFCLLQFKHLD